jgi:uncharacterized protein (TIGR03067 family)
MRRIAGFSMAVALLILALGCGKKASTESGGGGGGGGGGPGTPSASESIEGTYTIVGLEERGKALPADMLTKGPEADRTVKLTADKFIVSKNGKELPITYKLNTSKNPKEIDMAGKDAKGKQETSYGIYKLEGDKLTICMADSDKMEDRPKEFKTTKASKATILVLQKKK